MRIEKVALESIETGTLLTKCRLLKNAGRPSTNEKQRHLPWLFTTFSNSCKTWSGEIKKIQSNKLSQLFKIEPSVLVYSFSRFIHSNRILLFQCFNNDIYQHLLQISIFYTFFVQRLCNYILKGINKQIRGNIYLFFILQSFNQWNR